MAEGYTDHLSQNMSSNSNETNISAESVPSWSTKITCRYYLHGVCDKGKDCFYSHDLNSSRQSTVCTFYLQGQCSYGSKCRYDHIKPKKDSINNNNGTPNQTNSLNNKNKDNQNKSCSTSTPTPSSWSTPRPVNIHKKTSPDPSPVHGLVKLKKGHDARKDLSYANSSSSSSSCSSSSKLKTIDQWAKAAEFVPGQVWQGSAPTSYVNAVQTGLETSEDTTPVIIPSSSGNIELCPYGAKGECQYGENCVYSHGNLCDICGLAVLLPGDEEQNQQHMKECLQVIEDDMEQSFAIQRSKDKACGICMETVMEKKPASQQRFGILSDCCHVFCLSCIRTWRQAKSFENKIVRSCPECRVKSDFVTPSKYWVEDEAEKKNLIQGYKKALSLKPCKHFDQGRGECPFNQHCFYLHTYPDGRIASPQPRRRRQRADSDGNMEILERIFLWDFLEERQNRGLSTLEDDLEDIFIQLSLMHSLDSDDDTDIDFSDFEDASLDFLTT